MSPLKARLAVEGATISLGDVTITRLGERVVFTGSPTGDHSLDYEQSSASRIIAHAKGYAATAAERAEGQ
jgi:hypothetical protein